MTSVTVCQCWAATTVRPRLGGTNLLVVLYPLIAIIYRMLLRGVVGPRLGIEMAGPGLQLEALRCRRDHSTLLLGHKGRLLLCQLALLVLQLLLLEELDLCVDVVHDCLVRGRRRHHGRRDCLVGRRAGHRRHLVVQRGARVGSREDIRRVGAGHWCVRRLPMRGLLLHHMAAAAAAATTTTIGIVEFLEFELEVVGHVGHAAHVEELLEVIFGAGLHGVAPSNGIHDGVMSRIARARGRGGKSWRKSKAGRLWPRK